MVFERSTRRGTLSLFQSARNITAHQYAGGFLGTGVVAPNVVPCEMPRL